MPQKWLQFAYIQWILSIFPASYTILSPFGAKTWWVPGLDFYLNTKLEPHTGVSYVLCTRYPKRKPALIAIPSSSPLPLSSSITIVITTDVMYIASHSSWDLVKFHANCYPEWFTGQWVKGKNYSKKWIIGNFDICEGQGKGKGEQVRLATISFELCFVRQENHSRTQMPQDYRPATSPWSTLRR